MSVISYHMISYDIIWYHIISYHIISYHLTSYHIVSYRIVPYHIILYHIMSYHIISYHIAAHTHAHTHTYRYIHIHIYIYIIIYIYTPACIFKLNLKLQLRSCNSTLPWTNGTWSICQAFSFTLPVGAGCSTTGAAFDGSVLVSAQSFPVWACTARVDVESL